MNALILAAGTGSRLVDLTRNQPKALVRVGGVPLIDHTLNFLEELRCESVTVVGGFFYDMVVNHLAGHKRRVSIHFVENKEFLKGSVLTLQAGLRTVSAPFILCNVDHIYPRSLARALRLEIRVAKGVLALADYDRPLSGDDMKIRGVAAGKIERISKTIDEFDGGYIGMSVVPESASEQYRSAAATVATSNPEASAEAVLQQLVADGSPPLVVDTSGHRWLEIDDQRDLLNADRILRNKPGFLD